jgi:NDP-sugar pyrophosphorylase family protein
MPKPMLPIGDRPFLDYVIEYLRWQGVSDIVLSVCYRAEVVEQHFGSGSGHGVRIRYSRESEPAGTAGALRYAAAILEAPTWLVMNGDSFVFVDLATMLGFHRKKGAKATLALARVSDSARFGRVHLSSDGAIERFEEKSQSGPGLVNAGVYLIERRVVSSIPERARSLEREVFPALVGRGAYGFLVEGPLIDIGTPEEYRRVAECPETLTAWRRDWA